MFLFSKLKLIYINISPTEGEILNIHSVLHNNLFFLVLFQVLLLSLRKCITLKFDPPAYIYTALKHTVIAFDIKWNINWHLTPCHNLYTPYIYNAVCGSTVIWMTFVCLFDFFLHFCYTVLLLFALLLFIFIFSICKQHVLYLLFDYILYIRSIYTYLYILNKKGAFIYNI